MSDAPTEDASAPVEAPEATESEAPAETEPWDPERAKAKIHKSNQEAARLRARLKEMEPLAQKARDLEENQKTEAQRLNEALEAERANRSKAELALLRWEVASERGLPSRLAQVLHGESREELEAMADVLLEELNGGRPKITEKPRPRLDEPRFDDSTRAEGYEDMSPDHLAALIAQQ